MYKPTLSSPSPLAFVQIPRAVDARPVAVVDMPIESEKAPMESLCGFGGQRLEIEIQIQIELRTGAESIIFAVKFAVTVVQSMAQSMWSLVGGQKCHRCRRNTLA